MDLGYLIDNGGPLLWPLLCLSIAALAAGIERSIFFAGGGGRVVGPDPAPQLTGGAVPDKETLKRLRCTAGGRVLLCAREVSVGATGWVSLDQVIHREFGRLRRKIRALDAIITAAPLLGILGTVIGLVNGFAVPAATGDASRKALTDGVAQALATTVLGLCIAVMALIIRHAVSARAEAAQEQLEDYVYRVETALTSIKEGGS